MELPGDRIPTRDWPEEAAGSAGPEGASLQIDPPRSRPKAWGFLAEFARTVLLTLILFIAVRSVVQNFQIEGPSMQPTLQSGQYLMVNRLAYLRLEGAPAEWGRRLGLFDEGEVYPFGGPQRGDIIIFVEPIPPYVDLVKRLIALPGDWVMVDHGQVYLNGVPLQEDYVRSTPSYSLPARQVPPGSLFVLGDNRPVSSNSHLWGFVPEANVIGKGWIRYWPPQQWGILGNPLRADPR